MILGERRQLGNGGTKPVASPGLSKRQMWRTSGINTPAITCAFKCC